MWLGDDDEFSDTSDDEDWMNEILPGEDEAVSAESEEAADLCWRLPPQVCQLPSSPFHSRLPLPRNSILMRPPAKMIVGVVLLWAICWVSTTRGLRDLDSDLIETETGWQFEEDRVAIYATNGTAPAPAPASSSNTVALINGNFESTNLTGNASFTLADNTSTAIINWQAGGAGVQILNSNTYCPPPTTPSSVYSIHLNNPASTANGTQGSLMTTLAVSPASGKSFTVQFDCARNPDGAINLFPALRVSSISGTTVNAWEFREPIYNATDTEKVITWVRYSFIYTGTGAATMIKFESMSEKYGPIIDNVAILTGKHALAVAPGPSKVSLCQRIFPLFTVMALLAFNFLPAATL